MESSDDESADANRFDDAEDDVEEDFRGPIADLGGIAPGAAPAAVIPVAFNPVAETARGKPQAMAAALAAAKAPEVKMELEAEKKVAEAMAVVAEPVALQDAQVVKMEDVQATLLPESEAVVKPPPKKKKRKQTKKSPASTKKSTSSTTTKSIAVDMMHPSLNDPVDPITDAEYKNLAHLFEYFCKVPLLAEFSRPVTLLHPELMVAYSKIVSNPIDLGKICRKIGRRQYANTREVQLDMWRIFANCVKYHSHPSNKDGVPSFVSIALHLREFFNNLFQEWMLPSDTPKKALTGKGGTASVKYLRETYATREEDRKRRLIVSGLTCMSIGCMKKTAENLQKLLDNRGRVDELDTEPIFPLPGEGPEAGVDADDHRDLLMVVEKLAAFKVQLVQLAADNTEFTVEQFDVHLKACYETEVFENNPGLKFRVRNRMNRFLHKILCPINEANCRGVTQSSIWGCMAAAIWARESSKKPFWPALVLGILAPDDQKEDWHWALTDRNERRLPEALRTQLATGKRKAELALKRQSQGQADPQSFFLVEFLGTHEFIWVRETDIVESFEPDDDPNVKMQLAKKKRSGGRVSNAIVGSKKYQAAIEEAGWALEEFEMQLQDACGDMGDDEEGEDGNYSYSVLCTSDDEADEAYDDSKGMTVAEMEEANELIATRGLIDFSPTGRKNAKKRAQALKKQKAELEKKDKLEKAKKAKAEQSKKKKKVSSTVKSKDKEGKKEVKELEKRRKKRTREREKMLKSARKNKRRRTDDPDQQKSGKDGGDLLTNKRARATAVCKGYLTRMAKDEEYRSLGIQGIMNIPGALVDSSGLIGMALAFRAAAGEIDMPEESGDHDHTKPWDKVNVNDKMQPEEREQALRKQIELLEHEIKHVRATTSKRVDLAREAEDLFERQKEEIFADEEVARVNQFKKKKKVISGSATKGNDDSPAEIKSEMAPDDNDAEMKDVEVELGPSHVSSSPPKAVKDEANGGEDHNGL